MKGARIEFWKNRKNEYNYRVIGKNGKLLAGITQGFKRKAGMRKNITALHGFFHGFVDWNKMVEVKK